MALEDLKLALKIKALVEGSNNIVELKNGIKDLGITASKPIPDPTPPMREGAKQTTSAVQDLEKSLVGLVSIAAIKQFVDESVNQFTKAESAYRGLESVANHAGVGIGQAMQAAEQLAADGYLNVAESSKALQNLLARGFSVDQAVEMIGRLKDAAIYNRQANLSMGEAVVSATEGLKNENSILVDNAGVTKNVSVMWKEYAQSIGKTVDELTLSEKRQAEHNGIMRETEAQAGNTTKAMGSYQQQIASADAKMSKFAANMGQILAPLMLWLRQIGVGLVDYVFKPLVFYFQSMGVELARDLTKIGILKDALFSLDFSKVNEKWDAANKLAEEQKTQLAGKLDSGKLGLQPLGDGDKKAAADTTEAGAEMAKALKQAAKDRKDSVNEQIKDAEKLRDALIKAFDDSLKAEKDYRDQAKKLRAEAAAPAKDSSVEGQASATLDLIAAEQKLQRIKNTAPLEDVQAQAEQVRTLAGNLDDQARAQEAVNRSKLAEADALDRAAAGQKAQQDGITAQQKLNDERLAKLQQILKDLDAGKTVKIDADTKTARTAIEQVQAMWDAIQDKTVTLTVKQAGAAAPGAIPGHATGTILPGYGGGDRRLILAEDGEAITRKEAVAYYGRSFMAALNARQIPRFAEGGIVSSIASASVSAGGSGLHPVTLQFPGVGEWPVSATPDVVGQLKSALAREALKRGRRI